MALEYLGHIISGNGVQADPAKLKAMREWPIPQNLKELRGSLGLTRCCRRFMRGYGQLAEPLTRLLRKNAFEWSEEATMAVEKLKDTMEKLPILSLPNFTNDFIIETDASGYGLGEVLS